ncbi:helix-turn-helix domain-containing protein [Mycobacterium szulgai]|uniref:helix-turn-helix domain-containing protein n=1 Tax=Mycobacterium szulgai TaxID=1787 RepID=UPI001FE65C78|nr:helix-turn-helix domain-containing protein [Mycobacterium szulgai]
MAPKTIASANFATPAGIAILSLCPTTTCRRCSLTWLRNSRRVSHAVCRRVAAAKRLIAAGVNDCAISRQLGVPRPTVQDWRQSTSTPAESHQRHGVRCCAKHVGTAGGALLLRPGMYLGDGCISRCRQVWRLRITLDKTYPEISLNTVPGRSTRGRFG